jgi:hypothetical protein
MRNRQRHSFYGWVWPFIPSESPAVGPFVVARSVCDHSPNAHPRLCLPLSDGSRPAHCQRSFPRCPADRVVSRAPRASPLGRDHPTWPAGRRAIARFVERLGDTIARWSLGEPLSQQARGIQHGEHGEGVQKERAGTRFDTPWLLSLVHPEEAENDGSSRF